MYPTIGGGRLTDRTVRTGALIGTMAGVVIGLLVVFGLYQLSHWETLLHSKNQKIDQLEETVANLRSGLSAADLENQQVRSELSAEIDDLTEALSDPASLCDLLGGQWVYQENVANGLYSGNAYINAKEGLYTAPTRGCWSTFRKGASIVPSDPGQGDGL